MEATLRSRVPRRCGPCAPTPADVATVASVQSAAFALYPGIERGSDAGTPVAVRSPWQRVQSERTSVTVRSTCVFSASPDRPAVVYPGPWHFQQLGFGEWCVVALSGGGA